MIAKIMFFKKKAKKALKKLLTIFTITANQALINRINSDYFEEHAKK